MLPSLATVAELQARVGTIDDEDRAQAALDDASAAVRAETGRTWVDDDDELTAVPDIAKAVVLAAAARRWRNPDGFSSETIDDYTYRRPSGATELLTEGEVRQLRSLKAGGISTMQMYRFDEEAADTEWVDVVGDGDPIPWDVSG